MSEILDALDEWKALVYDRKPYEVVWDAIDENLLPNITRLAETQDNSDRGSRRDSKIIDGSPRLALSTFQAGLQGRLMTANFDWVAIQTPDEDMMDDRETRQWLSRVNAILAMLLNRSRFYPECYTIFGVAGGMGTGSVYHYYDAQLGREIFSCRNPWEMYFADNLAGEKDTAVRNTLMTARNIVTEFKNDIVAEEVTRQAGLDSEKHFETRVIHRVSPNPAWEPGKRDKRAKRFLSQYIDVDHEVIMREGGYDVFPYATWAIEKEVNEAYGRGPGWRALCDIKGLYAYAKTDILAAQLAVNPAYDIPAERRGNTKLGPGGRNYYDELNREIRVINPQSDLRAGLEREQHKQAIIEKHFMVPFFTSMLQAGVKDARERTAYEVQQIEQEAAILLGPYAMGFQIQFMDNVVEALFWDGLNNRIIPPPPRQLIQSLNGQKLEASYSGPLAQAQKNFFASEPYRKTLQDIQNILSVDPTGQHIPYEVLDVPDWDRMFKEMARANGVPEESIKEDRIIAAIRDQRQKAMAQRQKMDALMAAGKAAPGLNQTPQPGSPAAQLAQQKQPVAAA